MPDVYKRQVDCGDHGVSTVTKGDDFGRNNSVTDQIYGKDAETGYSWGAVSYTHLDVYKRQIYILQSAERIKEENKKQPFG